jgi:hypothetical protein
VCTSEIYREMSLLKRGRVEQSADHVVRVYLFSSIEPLPSFACLTLIDYGNNVSLPDTTISSTHRMVG